jgi:hypothetical protein
MPEQTTTGAAVPAADTTLSAEDAKLVTLARGARARIGAVEGAAVRDSDGRTYAGANVVLPSLSVTAPSRSVNVAVNTTICPSSLIAGRPLVPPKLLDVL